MTSFDLNFYSRLDSHPPQFLHFYVISVNCSLRHSVNYVGDTTPIMNINMSTTVQLVSCYCEYLINETVQKGFFLQIASFRRFINNLEGNMSICYYNVFFPFDVCTLLYQYNTKHMERYTLIMEPIYLLGS